MQAGGEEMRAAPKTGHHWTTPEKALAPSGHGRTRGTPGHQLLPLCLASPNLWAPTHHPLPQSPPP